MRECNGRHDELLELLALIRLSAIRNNAESSDERLIPSLEVAPFSRYATSDVIVGLLRHEMPHLPSLLELEVIESRQL